MMSVVWIQAGLVLLMNMEESASTLRYSTYRSLAHISIVSALRWVSILFWVLPAKLAIRQSKKQTSRSVMYSLATVAIVLIPIKFWLTALHIYMFQPIRESITFANNLDHSRIA